MRFTKEKELIEAYLNSTRKQKTRFLWLPVTIDGETRWLETATIEYKVKKSDTLCGIEYSWKPWQFINK